MTAIETFQAATERLTIVKREHENAVSRAVNAQENANQIALTLKNVQDQFNIALAALTSAPKSK